MEKKNLETKKNKNVSDKKELLEEVILLSIFFFCLLTNSFYFMITWLILPVIYACLKD